MNTLEALALIDATLAKRSKPWPAVSPWWRETLARFISSGKRTLVLRVGRRGGKSSTLCRVAVALALFGQHEIPPGDVGVVAFVSSTRDEARQRLSTIREILDALDVPYKPAREGSLELVAKPIAFRVYAGTLQSAVGFTSIAIFCDELARWRDDDSGVNPARSVVGSLRPTMSTQPNARMFLSSSPWAMADHHYYLFERGDQPDQMVAHAESWIANPTLDPDLLRQDAPEERDFDRDFRAIPVVNSSAVFSPENIAAAFTPRPGLRELGASVIAMDPSEALGKDQFGLLRGSYRSKLANPRDAYMWEDGIDPNTGAIVKGLKRVCDANGNPVHNPAYGVDARPILVVSNVTTVEAHLGIGVSMEAATAFVAEGAVKLGARTICSDLRERWSFASAFARAGLEFVPMKWTNSSKGDGVALLKRRLVDRTIYVEAGGLAQRLKDQLLLFTEHVQSSGTTTYRGRGSTHDDLVCALLTLCMFDAHHGIAGGPTPSKARGARELQTISAYTGR
jgi:Terminase large subunit, T4likevirus-type, N-terminal